MSNPHREVIFRCHTLVSEPGAGECMVAARRITCKCVRHTCVCVCRSAMLRRPPTTVELNVADVLAQLERQRAVTHPQAAHGGDAAPAAAAGDRYVRRDEVRARIGFSERSGL